MDGDDIDGGADIDTVDYSAFKYWSNCNFKYKFLFYSNSLVQLLIK